jgi:hypothetical protein
MNAANVEWAAWPLGNPGNRVTGLVIRVNHCVCVCKGRSLLSRLSLCGVEGYHCLNRMNARKVALRSSTGHLEGMPRDDGADSRDVWKITASPSTLFPPSLVGDGTTEPAIIHESSTLHNWHLYPSSFLHFVCNWDVHISQGSGLYECNARCG